MFHRLRLALLLLALCGPAHAAGIVFSGAADLGNNNGSSNNWSASYNVGTGNNRILVTCLTVINANDSFTVTYNGVTMSGPSAANFFGGIVLFYLINPASGMHTLAVTNNVGPNYIQILAADYTGANQNNQPATTVTRDDTNPNDTFSGTFTTIQSGATVIGCANNNFGSGAVPTVSGSFTRRIYGTQYGNTLLADFGPVVPAGDVTLTATIASGAVDKQGQSFLSLLPAPSGSSFMLNGVGQ